MRRSQKDFFYLIGSLGFAFLCLSDFKNMWKMFLFMIAFAGLNFYNYIRHKRNEEKWDDMLDDMYGDEDEDNDRKKKRNKESKDKFNDYIRSIEEQYEWEDEEEGDEDDDF